MFWEGISVDLAKHPKTRNSFPISATNLSGQSDLFLFFFKQSTEFPSWLCLNQPV
jgi:hypothetical protein